MNPLAYMHVKWFSEFSFRDRPLALAQAISCTGTAQHPHDGRAGFSGPCTCGCTLVPEDQPVAPEPQRRECAGDAHCRRSGAAPLLAGGRPARTGARHRGGMDRVVPVPARPAAALPPYGTDRGSRAHPVLLVSMANSSSPSRMFIRSAISLGMTVASEPPTSRIFSLVTVIPFFWIVFTIV